MTQESLTNALSQWAFKVASSFLPAVRIPQTSGVGSVMAMLGIDLSRYNVWNELGFLAEPVIKTMLTPIVSKYFGSMSEEQLTETVDTIVNSCISQAKERGHVNVFGIELKEDAFEGLKSMLYE